MGKTLNYAEFQKPNFSVKRIFANMEFLIKVVQYGKFKRKMVRCVTASIMGWNPLWRRDVIFFIWNFTRSMESPVSAVLIGLVHGLVLSEIHSKQGKFPELVRFSNPHFQKFSYISPDQTSSFSINSWSNCRQTWSKTLSKFRQIACQSWI